MGHATVTNISQTFNRLLRSKPTSIREVVEELKRKNQMLHASEGRIDDECMLGAAVQYIVAVLLDEGAIEPFAPTKAQRVLLKAWKNEEDDDWDSGDDGQGGEYGVFDTLRWKAKKKRLPLVNQWET